MSGAKRDRAPWFGSVALEVWARFLLALAGLGLAFAAAVFSTAAGRAGNLWASVVLASMALLTAAFVGLVTVPFLARRVALERVRQSLHFEVTRVGVVYVLVTLVIGIAALNTGNNLLYIVVAAMLAAILVSGVVSAMVLRGLELEIVLPNQAFAGRAIQGRVALRNKRSTLPSLSIRVVPADEKKKKLRRRWRWEQTTFSFPPNREPGKQWLQLRDWRVRRAAPQADVPGIFKGVVYFPYLPAKAALASDVELRFDRRGRYRQSSFEVATRFPFAFLIKSREISLKREILVYPAVDETTNALQILPRLQGEWESFIRGRGSDLYRIREYMPEDSARHVDWKATAKSGSLKVREFSREEEHVLRLVFDNPASGQLSEVAYERAVSLAASLAWHFAGQNADVWFQVLGDDRTRDIHAFLAQLAVIEPIAPDSKPIESPDFTERIPAGEYRIIVTARDRESLPAYLTLHCSLIFAGEPSSAMARK